MRWWQVAGLIVAVEYAVALSIGAAIGFHYEIPLVRLSVAAFGIATIGLLGYAFARVAWFAFCREDAPCQRLAADLRGKVDFPTALFLVAAQMAVLAWLKSTMPHAVGFWADPALADLDAAIFGTDPWKLFPDSERFGRIIDRLYVTWGFVMLGTMLALSLAPQSRPRDTALVTYFLLIAISAMLQYSMPSAGPLFYEAVGHGSRFAELQVRPWVRDTAAYLWDNYTEPGGRVGGGISAMPSVHVAGAAWLALTLASFFPALRVVGWAYFAAILIGSVYLGWHYAVDGLAGLVIALAAWKLAGTRWRRNADLPPHPTSVYFQ